MVKNPFRAEKDLNRLLYGSRSNSVKHQRQSTASSTKKDILNKQKGRCWKCHKVLAGSVHYHHLKHSSKGGKSTTSNLVAVCPTCHDIIHISERAREMDKKKKTHNTARQKNYFNPFGAI